MVCWVPTNLGCQGHSHPSAAPRWTDGLGTHGEHDFLVWEWDWIFIALSYYNLLSMKKKQQAQGTEWGK